MSRDCLPALVILITCCVFGCDYRSNEPFLIEVEAGATVPWLYREHSHDLKPRLRDGTLEYPPRTVCWAGGHLPSIAVQAGGYIEVECGPLEGEPAATVLFCAKENGRMLSEDSKTPGAGQGKRIDSTGRAFVKLPFVEDGNLNFFSFADPAHGLRVYRIKVFPLRLPHLSGK